MDAEYGMVESFLIDNGQLDGHSPQNCFVLGYELCEIGKMAFYNPSEFDKTVHAANIDRIEAFLRSRGRQWSWMWPSDDVSEEWVYLKVFERLEEE